jgi:hypothetical protein
VQDVRIFTTCVQKQLLSYKIYNITINLNYVGLIIIRTATIFKGIDMRICKYIYFNIVYVEIFQFMFCTRLED